MIAGHTHFSPDRVFGWLKGQLKESDIFDMSDILTKLNNPRLAPNYRGVELSAKEIDKWKDLVSPVFGPCKGLHSWHWIHLGLVESETPSVCMRAKNSSSQHFVNFQRYTSLNLFPDMRVESHAPKQLSEAILSALRFASHHIGSRTFRYL